MNIASNIILTIAVIAMGHLLFELSGSAVHRVNLLAMLAREIVLIACLFSMTVLFMIAKQHKDR